MREGKAGPGKTWENGPADGETDGEYAARAVRIREVFGPKPAASPEHEGDAHAAELTRIMFEQTGVSMGPLVNEEDSPRAGFKKGL